MHSYTHYMMLFLYRSHHRISQNGKPGTQKHMHTYIYLHVNTYIHTYIHTHIQSMGGLTTILKRTVEAEAKRAVEEGLKSATWKKEVRITSLYHDTYIHTYILQTVRLSTSHTTMHYFPTETINVCITY